MNLEAQMTFLRELDKLKAVIRQTQLVDGSRRENTAEHSWHIAMAALTLSEYSDEPVDVLRVIKMLLLHDIVEIDAGDTFAFDKEGYEDKDEREQQAADRLFGLLPDAQRDEYMALWHEFEAMESADAKFARSIDQFLPFLHNMWTDGASSWVRNDISYEQVYQRNVNVVGASSEKLWDYLQTMLDKAVKNGWLSREDS